MNKIHGALEEGFRPEERCLFSLYWSYFMHTLPNSRSSLSQFNANVKAKIMEEILFYFLLITIPSMQLLFKGNMKL